MIGAGLSLNARPKSPAVPPFPTWSGLAEKLVDGLYPKHPSNSYSRKHALIQTASTSGSLRLAEEYQAAFGRDALDRLLISAIPDSSYEPSRLHSLLLRLPWSDVFTTNYDTLLERSAKELIDVKYDIVRTPAELLDSSKPRIIKLHGSFPSNRPFIITEEDFRTYPVEFAPFVNLIRQSMLESTFCLIGFSGDDPNFLNWSGWVRDNLNKYSPTIYLCGLLGLSNARRKLLHDRNVIPVDLAPIFPTNNPNRHALALEWLFRTLDEGRWFPAPSKWPYRNRSNSGQMPLAVTMPEIPKPSFDWYSKERYSPENSQVPLTDDTAGNLITEWKVTRLSHPGWIVTPTENRDRLWFCTKNWIPYIFSNLPRVTLGMQLELLYELNWRFETCLVPLRGELSTPILETLRKFNPFAGEMKIDGAIERFDDESLKLPPIQELRRIWIELALASMRFSRESQDESNFQQWISILKPITSSHPELASRIRYQECLFYLGRLDHGNAKNTITAWNVSDDDPFWLIRQASVLVEIGEVVEAERRAEAGLRAIREGIRPGVDDLSMLSREGWAMKLVSAIKIAKSRNFALTDREFLGRWERLTEKGCNPNPELDLLEERLRRPIPGGQSKTETEFSFDFGRISQNYSSGASILDQVIPALQTIRLVEEAAYPPECGSWTLSKKLLSIAVTWINDYWPEIASSLLLRLSDSKLLEQHLNRNSLARLPESTILSIYRIFDKSLTHGLLVLSSSEALADEWIRSVARDLVSIGVEFLSRIVFRLPQVLVLEEFRRAISYYKNNVILRDHIYYGPLGNLFSRSIVSLDATVLREHLRELFLLPIPGVDGFGVELVDGWPEPIESMDVLDFDDARQADPNGWAGIVRWLLEAMLNSNEDARRRASMRLTMLWLKNFLTELELDQFSSAIWSRRDPNTGLPASVAIKPIALLQLPEPETGIAVTVVKNYCLKSNFAPLYTTTTSPEGKTIKNFSIWTDTGAFLEAIVEASRIDNAKRGRGKSRTIKWTKGELDSIFEKLNLWWQVEGKELSFSKNFDISRNHYLERFRMVSSVIALVILPNCRANSGLAERIKRLIFDFASNSLPILSMMPPLLGVYPDLLDETVARIRQGLFSKDEEHSREAIEALFRWSTQMPRRALIQAPPDLLRDFGSLISNRSMPALLRALAYGRHMLGLLPLDRQAVLLPSLIVGLSYLLDETNYRNPAGLSDSIIPTNLIPEIRLRASQLAAAISRSSFGDNLVIKKWLEAIEIDPVPEVRRAREPDSE